MTILWPVHLLRPQNPSFDIAPRSLAGPSSVSGFSQTVSSDAGIWKVRFGSVIIRNRAHVLTWRAIDTLLEGRLNPILLPRCRDYQPVPDGAVDDGLYDEVPHDDDTLFDDDTGYVGQVIDVVLDGSIAARAVSATIGINYANTLEPGQDFSFGERMYRLRSVDYVADDAATITFRPTLREAVTSGEQLNFDNPVVRCRLATDNEMNLELALRRSATPSVSFIEDL